LFYDFEWDPIKNHQNQQKHTIGFERAATVFQDPRAVTIFDDEHSLLEERWITLGIDRTGILIVVCHTYKKELKDAYKIRIFSARKATMKETQQYGVETI
jgi:uncharacterized protein